MNKKLHLKHSLTVAMLFVFMLLPGIGRGQIAGWDFSMQPGGSGNYGTNPLAVITKDANATIGGLTRAAGFGTLSGSGAAAAWGSNNFTVSGTLAGEIAANKFFTFSINANPGYKVSLSGIGAYNIRRSASGPTTGQWQYQTGSGSFVDIGNAITWGTVTTSAGNSQPPIDLSNIADLQNVSTNTTITLRLVCYGATGTVGTVYLNDLGNNGSNDLILNGSVVSTSPPTIAVSSSALSGFSYIQGHGPSAVQNFSAGGTSLSSGITITAPADYELSETSDGTFSGSILLAPSNGSVPNTILYVRLKAGLSAGDFDDESITLTSTDAISKAVTCNGSVAPPPQITWANLQWPPTGTISLGGIMAVFAQVYAPGITDAAGQGAGITAWIGCNNTESNWDPTTWTNWVPARYNTMFTGMSNDEYIADLGMNITSPGTYYYASRFQLGTGSYVYGCLNGLWSGSPSSLGVLTVGPAPQIDWANLESPASGTITLGAAFNVTALVNEPGITNSPGKGSGITAEIGYNTTNTDPGTWTKWVPATYSGDAGTFIDQSSDAYTTDLGAVLTTPGIYYYASRFRMGAAAYVYGGYNGGFWDGTTNISGVLTVNEPPVATYTWQGLDNASWNIATNWTPARTAPAINDILKFNDGTSKTITAVPTQTIGQLFVSDNTAVNLQAGGAVTLTIRGGSGADLTIAAGSALKLSAVAAANAINLSLLTGATAGISGNMSFTGAGTGTAHRLSAADASAVMFSSGAVFTAGGLFTGNPFGTENLNSVIFASGSVYIAQAGSDPFGANKPGSVVAFQTGSLYKLIAGPALSLSGRTYANLEIDAPGSVITADGDYATSVNNLVITNGTLNFNMTASPGHSIKGNITVSAGGVLHFAPALAGTVALNGSAVQTISNAGTLSFGTNSTLVVDNPAGISVSNPIELNNLTLMNGIVSAGANVLTVNGNIAGGSATSCIDGKLARVFTAAGAPKAFAIGKNGNYRPLTLNFISLDNPVTVTAEQTESTMPGTLPSNTTLFGARYWTLSQTGGSNYQYVVTLDATGFTPANTAIMLKGDELKNSAYAVTTPDYTNAAAFTAFGNFGLGGMSAPTAYNVTGTGSFCSGATGLSVGLDGSGTGVTYTLYKNGAAREPAVNGTGSAISFGSQAAGTYTVSASNIGGTTPMIGNAVLSEIAAAPVSVTIAPDVSNVCAGASVILTATPVNGGTPTYRWYRNTLPVGSNIPTYTFVPVDRDQVHVVLTSGLSCTTGNPATSAISVMTVITTPAPVISRTGNTLSSTSPTGNQWYKNSAIIAGATNATYAVTMDGTYYDIVTLNGCSSNPSNSLVVVYDAITDPMAGQFEVFPVPNNGQFTATIACPAAEIFTIRVYNSIGSLAYEKKDVPVNGSARLTIDMRPVLSGMYTVTFTSASGQVVRKMMISRD